MLGSPVIKTVLAAIPKFVISGLGIATGLLPAYGFALLLKMMINKHNAVFFVFGFALAAYLKISVTGVAIFGACLALILTGYSAYKDNHNQGTGNGPKDNNGGVNKARLEGLTMKMKSSKHITHKDLMKVFWRSFTMEWAWNYERQMNLGYAFSLVPVLKKIYSNSKEKLAEAYKRHLAFYNVTPCFRPFHWGFQSPWRNRMLTTLTSIQNQLTMSKLPLWVLLVD